MTSPRMMLKLLVLALCAVGSAFATTPMPEVEYWTAAPEPVSLFCLPNGGGDPLTEARAFGGARIDATVTVRLTDTNGDPVPLYPKWDIFLDTENNDLLRCPAGTIADHDTDHQGRTTFTAALRAGGTIAPTGAEDLRVSINGNPFDPGLEIYCNSPDINGDLVVNLIDVSLFAQDYYGAYAYRSDYFWDGVLNLSDVALLATGNGAQCP